MNVFPRLSALGISAFLVFLNFGGTSPQQDAQPASTRTSGDNTSQQVTDTSGAAGLAGETRIRIDEAQEPLPEDVPFPVPTNAWWSSGLLDEWPAPQFPIPFRVEFSGDGVRLNNAGVSVTAKTLFHTQRDALILEPVAAPVRATVRSWGDFDVTFRMHGKSGPLLDVSLVRGSPTVHVQLHEDEAGIALPPQSSVSRLACDAPCTSAALIEAPHAKYVVAAGPGGTLYLTDEYATARGADFLTVSAVAPQADPRAYLPRTQQPVQETTVGYSVSKRSVQTTYEASRPMLMGVLPHHYAYLKREPGELVGTYETLRGPLRVYRTSGFRTELPHPPVLPGLPPAPGWPEPELLRKDLEIRRSGESTVYNAGKNLWRLAHLTELSAHPDTEQLHGEAAKRLQGMLVDWCTESPAENAQLFAYDERLGGLIGMQPAYGSEHYNDHHFHLGYFLRAMVTELKERPAFAGSYGKCIDFMVRDIASGDRNDPKFPYLRYFDPYAGHSWANGLTRFEDGQNQESTSEAMQAWHALTLLGRVLGRPELQARGAWLYAQEASAARGYWFDALPGVSTLPEDFPAPMISILWQGKADYTTFFDPDPAAIHGIQFFPVSSVLLSVVTPDIIDRLVEPLAEPDSLWGTTLELVAALGDGAAALPDDDVPFEPAYSRSYVAAWAASLRHLGQYVPEYTSSWGCGAVFRNGRTLRAVMYRYPADAHTCTVYGPSGTQQTFTDLPEGWTVRRME